MSLILYYVHDPMCSWCYAFGPVWRQVSERLPPGIEVRRLLGGLAPGTEETMADDMRRRLEDTWHRIERKVPGTRFNFEFWKRCTPRRSTYPSCRAVIAARNQGSEYDERMTHAIQRAYYREARNPSDTETLIELAAELGLDGARFAADLAGPETEAALQEEIGQARAIGADSFPALVLSVNGSRWPVAINYNSPAPILDAIDFLLEEDE